MGKVINIKHASKKNEKEFVRLILSETPNFGLQQESEKKSYIEKELSDKKNKEICDLIRKNTKSF